MSLFTRYYRSRMYVPDVTPPPDPTYEESVIAMLGAGLIGYWPMDEVSGNLVDRSGNGWTATKGGSGTATYEADGPVIASVAQKAIQTDGDMRFVTSSSFTQANAVVGISLFGWVYLDSTSSAQGVILARQNSGSDRIAVVRHSSNGTCETVFFTAGGDVIGQANQTDLDGGTWRPFVAWWDPADQDVRLSISDASPASTAGAANIDESVSSGWSMFSLANGTTPLRAGCRLAHVGVYHGVLTAGQRTSLATGVFS